MGKALETILLDGSGDRQLDLGCIASHGHFARNGGGGYDFVSDNKPATAFLFALISKLQFSGTVPMIDIDAYGEWLAK